MNQYSENEIRQINKLLKKSKKEIEDGKFGNFEKLLLETKKKYGL